MLVVDADAVLTSAIAAQGFQPVAWRDPQVVEAASDLQLPELAAGHSLERLEAWHCPSMKSAPRAAQQRDRSPPGPDAGRPRTGEARGQPSTLMPERHVTGGQQLGFGGCGFAASWRATNMSTGDRHPVIADAASTLMSSLRSR